MLLKLAARGGMGDVYLAATIGIEGAERPCIVKTVRRDHMHDGSFLARFLDEARVQSQLQHPGVAQVLEAATDENGEPYTAVEYVEGRSLSDVRQRAVQMGVRVAWADAVAIAMEVAQALAHVHDRAGRRRHAARDRAPRPVAAERDGELRGRGQAHRLRDGARPQPPLPHGRGRRLREARIRGARGGAPAGGRRAHRSLRPRHHALGAQRGPPIPDGRPAEAPRRHRGGPGERARHRGELRRAARRSTRSSPS